MDDAIAGHGYMTEQPNRGMTIEQSQLTIEKLATFHAVSAAHIEQVASIYHPHSLPIIKLHFRVQQLQRMPHLKRAH